MQQCSERVGRNGMGEIKWAKQSLSEAEKKEVEGGILERLEFKFSERKQDSFPFTLWCC